MRREYVNKRTKSRLHKLYSMGKLTHFQIAEKLGLEYKQVYGFYDCFKHKEYYTKPPRNPRTRRNYLEPILMANVEKAYAFYLGGLTLAQVGERFGGVTRERVRQVFKINGLKSRHSGFTRRKTAYVCDKGHKLGKKEYPKTCKKCRIERRKLREKGFHLVSHCKQGHAIAGPNLMETFLPSGIRARRCRVCAYAANRKSILKKKKRL